MNGFRLSGLSVQPRRKVSGAESGEADSPAEIGAGDADAEATAATAATAAVMLVATTSAMSSMVRTRTRSILRTSVDMASPGSVDLGCRGAAAAGPKAPWCRRRYPPLSACVKVVRAGGAAEAALRERRTPR